MATRAETATRAEMSVADIESAMKRAGLTQRDVAERAGVSASIVSRVVKGKYDLDTDAGRAVIAVIRQAANKVTPLRPDPGAQAPGLSAPWGGSFVTQGQRLLWALLKASVEDHEFALLTGPSGVGKTYVCQRFVEQRPEVLVFEAQMGQSASGLLSRLCRLFGVPAGGTNDDKRERLFGACPGRALIVDEADLLIAGRYDRVLSRIELFRQMQKAGAAVVLMGLPVLRNAVEGAAETYVHSRIGYARVAPEPTLDELTAYWRGQVAGYPQALAKAGPMALLAQRAGLFRFLDKLARRTRSLDGDVDAAASLLFQGGVRHD